MRITRTKPHANSRLVAYLQKRILELRPRKSQVEIAAEAGFTAVNTLAMIKSGSAKLPLDRVPGLAKALEDDPAKIFRMAMEQLGGGTTQAAVEQIFGDIVTSNERAWLRCLRDASGNSDPTLTSKAERSLRAIFGK